LPTTPANDPGSPSAPSPDPRLEFARKFNQRRRLRIHWRIAAFSGTIPAQRINILSCVPNARQEIDNLPPRLAAPGRVSL
jgi:hypothetical protein